MRSVKELSFAKNRQGHSSTNPVPRGFPGKAVYNFKEELVDILDCIFDIALLLVRACWDNVGILIIRGRLNKLEKYLQLVEN